MTHASPCRSAVLASLLGLLVGILVLPGLLTSAEPEKKEAPEKKLDPEVVKKRLFRSWREVVRIEEGRKYEASTDLFCHRFQPKEWTVWLFAGELSPSTPADEVRIDVTVDPMRFDMLARPGQMLGIVRFEGDHLVWVTSGWSREGPRALERPKEFTSTKENKYTLRVLKPCEYLDQVSTVKD
jgi:hypothetical protein